ncbi:MAG: threonine aldolase [Oscillospiraceae bacterium]|nr:threonine aldolase [Oscillospiraceae bacterium]
MIHFRNDYSMGAHPAVLEALCRTNDELTIGYGCDEHCESASETIRELCDCPGAAVHFFTGGTQVNKTAIGAFLRSYEAVIAPEAGHICVHESGAVEQDGHKVIHCPAPDGKLTPAILRSVCAGHTGEHMVAPKLVYISNTTEVGTVYSRGELQALREVCNELNLFLYCDGARLGCAMDAGDTAFEDYGAFCDAFTIGGTKNGLLFGEALVIVRPGLQRGFRHNMKQQGAILAKGRLLGVQFTAVLEGGLYLELAAHANRLGQKLAAGLKALGIPLSVDSPSNQIFPILPEAVISALTEDFTFETQGPAGEGRTCVRLVTSWRSSEEDVDAVLARLGELL